MKRPNAPVPVNRVAGAGSGTRPGGTAPQPDRAKVQSKAKALATQLAEQRRRSAWLSGFRFSAFSLIMAGVLTVGVLSLIPRVQELVTQRQQIAALQADIEATKASIAAKEAERKQWNDPNYIATQAREKLYFVKPGDVSYLVINDLTPGQLTQQTGEQATGTLEHTRSQWLGTLLSSVWGAGAAPVTPPTPTPTPSAPAKVAP